MTFPTLRALSLVATLATPLGALAQPDDARGHEEEATLVAMNDDVQLPRMGVPPQLAQRIGLTPEQQKQIQQLSFDANAQYIDLEAANRKAQLELKRLLAQDNPDEKAVLSQVDALARTEAAVRKNRLTLLLRIRKLVGPEKWQKLQAEMPQRRFQRRMLRMGPGGEGRQEQRQLRGGSGR